MPMGESAERSGLRPRTVRIGAAAVIAVLTVTACGTSTSANTPAAIGTSAAQSLNDAQFSDADAAAKTTLTPAPGSFLQGKSTVTTVVSTTPDNGDVNPYAIWPVKADMGALHTGDVLVDNFNNKSNDQGTGTTIVDVHPDKSVSVFATLPQNLSRVPRRCRADDGDGRSQRRLGSRRKPAQHRRQDRHLERGLPRRIVTHRTGRRHSRG